MSQVNQQEIIWHLGFQKTGTTSIQSGLRQNKSNFLQDVFVVAKDSRTQRMRNIGEKILRREDFNFRAKLERQTKRLLEEFVESGKRLAIISDENLFGYDLYEGDGNFVEVAKIVIPILESASHPIKSTFVFYTRDWEKWTRSAYNQAVKSRRCLHEFEDWEAKIPFPKNWESLYAELSGLVESDMFFFDMDEEVKKELPVGFQLLTLSGVPSETVLKFSPPRRANESLPRSARDFMLKVNQTEIQDDALQEVRKVVLSQIHHFR